MTVAVSQGGYLQSDHVRAKIYVRIAKQLTSPRVTLREFIKGAWPIIEPSRQFVPAWHIDAIAEHLEAVDAGQIKRLLINIPPRYGKSTLVSVLWPVWSWTDRPWSRWVFCSYASGLSVKHSRDRRLIIESDWFRNQWGNRVRLADDQNQKAEFQNTARGHMIATSVGGTITGKGCTRLVLDDLINPARAESKAEREASIEFYRTTLSTRLDDESAAIVAIEQRTHRADLSGSVLPDGGWTHLKLPAIAEKRESIVFPMTGRVVERNPGDLLWPARHDAAALARQKTVTGSRGFNAQFQQAPTSEEGAMFKRSWWQYYRELPKVRRRAWCWDTAVKTNDHNDFTVGMLIAECATGFYVEKMVKSRMEYPDLKRTIQIEQDARRADVIVVEDKSSGQQIIQDLRRNTSLPVVAFDGGGKDKILRAALASPKVEAGKVFLPEATPWVADFVETMAAFPDVEHDDDVDAFTSGIIYLTGDSGNVSVYVG
ncbi:MAG: terminase [Desulfurellales bacterium]|nr:MAG: terminase [Desulfurellales bacterium]